MPGLNLERMERVAQSFREGKTYREIGNSLSPPISKQRVYQIVRQHPERDEILAEHIESAKFLAEQRRHTQCGICDKVFFNKSGNRTFCSPECYREWRKRKAGK